MELVIKQAKVFDVNSPLNGGRHTLWLKDGHIHSIDQSYPEDLEVIEGADLVVTPSWVDLRAHFCDPGEEHKEDIPSGLRAAAAGGFAEVALVPDTDPVLQTKAQLQYVVEQARDSGLSVHLVAALTRDQAGAQMTDFFDLRNAGVVAFSDGYASLNNLQLLTQALRYLRPVNGLVIHRAEEASLSMGCMHEGLVSTSLGLAGVPAHAEEVALYNSLRVLEYTGGRLHVSCLSSAAAAQWVRKKRDEGLNLSADVAVQHLLFEDTHLRSFDPSYRSSPPYRTSEDRKALCRELAQGHIQAIVSDHRPQTPEDKMRPFAEALPGCITLQCVLPVLLRIQNDLPLESSLRALYEGPRRVLNLAVPTIQRGEPVELTVFDAEEEWRFDSSTNYSKSTNSPFFGQVLKGKVRAVLRDRSNLLPLCL